MGERSRTGRPSRLYLGLRCRQFTGDDGVAKTGSFVRAIAEGLVSRVAAAAKADGGPASQAESAAFGIDDLEIPLDADRTVVVDGDFGSSHSGLRKIRARPGFCRRTRSLDYADFNGNSRTPLAPLAPSLPAAFRSARRRRNHGCRFPE